MDIEELHSKLSLVPGVKDMLNKGELVFKIDKTSQSRISGSYISAELPEGFTFKKEWVCDYFKRCFISSMNSSLTDLLEDRLHMLELYINYSIRRAWNLKAIKIMLAIMGCSKVQIGNILGKVNPVCNPYVICSNTASVLARAKEMWGIEEGRVYHLEDKLEDIGIHDYSNLLDGVKTLEDLVNIYKSHEGIFSDAYFAYVEADGKFRWAPSGELIGLLYLVDMVSK